MFRLQGRDDGVCTSLFRVRRAHTKSHGSFRCGATTGKDMPPAGAARYAGLCPFVFSNWSVCTRAAEFDRSPDLPLSSSRFQGSSDTRFGVLNFQVLWLATVTILWLLVALATPSYNEPWGPTLLYYVPDQPYVVELPRSEYEATLTQGEMEAGGEEDDDESFWALATMAFWTLSLVWVGGIALTAFLAFDLGNGGNGRYPLRIPIFRSG